MINRRMFLTAAGAFSLPTLFADFMIAAPRKPTGPTRKAGVVETVLGPIAGDRLGFTATHEHVLASSTGFMRLWPEYLGGRSQFTSEVVERMKAAKAAENAFAPCAINSEFKRRRRARRTSSSIFPRALPYLNLDVSN